MKDKKPTKKLLRALCQAKQIKDSLDKLDAELIVGKDSRSKLL